MTRKRLLKSSEFPYFVTARCINREWFRLPLDQVWEIYSDYLYLTVKMFDVKIVGFVLMSNHFHFLIKTPLGNLDRFMNYFMRETSRIISTMSGRINQIYGGPYRGSLLTNERSFLCAYKYMYRNPVRALMSETVEDYPFSTLNGLLGRSKLIIPVQDDYLLFSNSEKTLKWLNQEFDKKIQAKIKMALCRPTFRFSKNNSNKPVLIHLPYY